MTQPSATSEPLTLRVGEALSKDVGRGVARLDPEDLERLGVAIGGAIAVRGKRTTVCKAMPAFKEQRGVQRVHLDALSRANAGVGIDDKVEISPAQPAPASRVVIGEPSVATSDRDLDYIGSLLDGLIATPGDRVRATLFGSRAAEFTVVSAEPAGPVVITPTTELIVKHGRATSNGQVSGEPAAQRLGYEDIGGLGPQMGRIREMIELPLRFPQVFERLGIDPPKGVLLHGPPGTGKTLIARTIAREAQANFFQVSGPEIVHKHYGESEKHLRAIWEQAAKQSPSIIFIDEIDSIAPKRERTEGEVEKRIVAQLLTLMDGLTRRANVVVIAATNLPNSIDPALRRPGRFDREIEIPIPDAKGRRQILEIHSRGMPLAENVNMDRVAEITHGCVGADLEALCREAAMACLRPVIEDIDFATGTLPWDRLQSLEITMDHFRQAMAEVEPSAIREVFVEVPDVSWDDIGGLGRVKRRLVEAVEWPLQHAALFAEAGARAPKGVLLAGPPGVGKTMLAKAAATQCGANFISVKGPELVSKYVGESERALREVFRKARQAAPCIIFFDEIDALLPKRGQGENPVAERLLSQFLAELDGVEELKSVLVLAATNRLDMLDPAVLRPGRFDEVVELEHPDEAARAEVYRVHLRGKPVAEGVDPADLAARSPGASGAQIFGVVQRAAMECVRRRVHSGGAGPLRIEPTDIDAAIEAELRF